VKTVFHRAGDFVIITLVGNIISGFRIEELSKQGGDDYELFENSIFHHARSRFIRAEDVKASISNALSNACSAQAFYNIFLSNLKERVEGIDDVCLDVTMLDNLIFATAENIVQSINDLKAQDKKQQERKEKLSALEAKWAD